MCVSANLLKNRDTSNFKFPKSKCEKLSIKKIKVIFHCKVLDDLEKQSIQVMHTATFVNFEEDEVELVRIGWNGTTLLFETFMPNLCLIQPLGLNILSVFGIRYNQ